DGGGKRTLDKSTFVADLGIVDGSAVWAGGGLSVINAFDPSANVTTAITTAPFPSALAIDHTNSWIYFTSGQAQTNAIMRVRPSGGTASTCIAKVYSGGAIAFDGASS